MYSVFFCCNKFIFFFLIFEFFTPYYSFYSHTRIYMQVYVHNRKKEEKNQQQK
jgi:hypothetical protein